MSIIISGQNGIDLNGKRVYDGTVDKTAYTIETISEFANVPSGVTTVIVKEEGRGGIFTWDAASTEVDNGGTIIQATGVTIGRWKRAYSGNYLLASWFGVKFFSSRTAAIAYGNQSVIVQSWITTCVALGKTPKYDAGHIYHGKVYIPVGCSALVGSGRNITYIYGAVGSDIHVFARQDGTFNFVHNNMAYGGFSIYIDMTDINVKNTTFRHRVGPFGENLGNCILAYDDSTGQRLAQGQQYGIQMSDIYASYHAVSGTASFDANVAFSNLITFASKMTDIQIHALPYGMVYGMKMARRISSINTTTGEFTVDDFTTIKKLTPQGSGYVLVESANAPVVGEKCTIIFDTDVVKNSTTHLIDEVVIPRKTYYIRSIAGNVVTLQDSSGNLVVPRHPYTTEGAWFIMQEEYNLEMSSDDVIYEVKNTASAKCALSTINGSTWSIDKSSFFYDGASMKVADNCGFGGPTKNRRADNWTGNIYMEGPFTGTYSNNRTNIDISGTNWDIKGIVVANSSLNLLSNINLINSSLECLTMTSTTKFSGFGKFSYSGALQGFNIWDNNASGWEITKIYDGNPNRSSKYKDIVVSKQKNLILSAHRTTPRILEEQSKSFGTGILMNAVTSTFAPGATAVNYDEDGYDTGADSIAIIKGGGTWFPAIDTPIYGGLSVGFGYDKLFPSGLVYVKARFKNADSNAGAFTASVGVYTGSGGYQSRISDTVYSALNANQGWVIVDGLIDASGLDGTDNGAFFVSPSITGTWLLDWIYVMPLTNATLTKTLAIGNTKHLTGTGNPEGTITANVGSTYYRTDGGASTTLYVKQSGSGNTGWAAK